MTRQHRRCTLCYTEYTPQWRRSRHTGGYLCNACGTRELREAQKLPGFQSRRMKKRTSFSSSPESGKRTPVKKITSYERHLAYQSLMCDSQAYEDIQMMVGNSPMSSSNTSTGTAHTYPYPHPHFPPYPSSPTYQIDTQHANQEVFAAWIVMMRLEGDVRVADRVVDAHPCHSGLSALCNLEPNMEDDERHSGMDAVRQLLESAVSLSRAVNPGNGTGQDRNRIEGMKSKYRAVLDDFLCREEPMHA